MIEFAPAVAALSAVVAGGIMTVGFAMRSTRWGTPLLMVGIVALLLVIWYGVVSKL